MKTFSVKDYIIMTCSTFFASLLLCGIISMGSYDSPFNQKKPLGAYIVSK